MTNVALRKILLVEDEEDIQEIVKIALEDVGRFTVQICDSGKQALQIAHKFMPQLILLDVMMPGMSGPQLLEIFHENETTRDIPIIFLTAKAQKNELEALKGPGVLSVITKPFDPLMLSDQIQLLWNGR
jgi:CheY-like chemotaxis protein